MTSKKQPELIVKLKENITNLKKEIEVLEKNLCFLVDLDNSISKSELSKPLKVNCFQCKKELEIKFVIPSKSYSRKNNWEYWTNPEAKNPEFWKDKEARKKDRQICNSCLLKLYRNKEVYWETIKDLKKRNKLRGYIWLKIIK